MSLLKPVTLFLLVIFSVSPVWAQNTDCCTDLRHEVKMIQDEVQTIKNQLKTQAITVSKQQTTTKTGFEAVGTLVDALHKHFPEIPGLETVKRIFDALNG